MSKVIWEGWTVQHFIDELTLQFNLVNSGNSWQKRWANEKELKAWLMDNQPYYKKHIPEVFNHFKALVRW